MAYKKGGTRAKAKACKPQSPAVNHNSKAPNPTSEKEQNVGKGSLEGRVAKLRQQLQEAEVEEALERAKGTMHGISSPRCQGQPSSRPHNLLRGSARGYPSSSITGYRLSCHNSVLRVPHRGTLENKASTSYKKEMGGGL